MSSSTSSRGDLLLPRWRRRRCSRSSPHAGPAPRVPSPSHPSNSNGVLLHGFPVARSRVRARARRAAISATWRGRRRRVASPRARRCAAGPMVFAIRCARNVSGSFDPIGSSTATRSSRSRTGPRLDAIASWMLSLDAMASNAPRGESDRRTDGRRASRRRARVRAPRTGARRARAGRRARADDAPAAPHPWTGERWPAAVAPATCSLRWRATVSRSRSASMSSSPASFITYWSRTRSLGCWATMSAPASRGAGAALERGEVGGRQHAVEAELEERCGALERTAGARPGRRATRRPGSLPAGRSATSSWIS